MDARGWRVIGIARVYGTCEAAGEAPVGRDGGHNAGSTNCVTGIETRLQPLLQAAISSAAVHACIAQVA